MRAPSYRGAGELGRDGGLGRPVRLNDAEVEAVAARRELPLHIRDSGGKRCRNSVGEGLGVKADEQERFHIRASRNGGEFCHLDRSLAPRRAGSKGQ